MRPVDFRPRLAAHGTWHCEALTDEAREYERYPVLVLDSDLEAHINVLLDHGFRVELDLSTVVD